MIPKKSKYSVLLQQYKNNIYSYSFYMLKNQMDAEDVTQEVLIKLWQNLDNVNILALKTWIMRTTHNLCIDYIRKRKTVQGKSFSIDFEIEEVVSDTVEINNPIIYTHVKMLTSIVKEAIKNLPENLRSIFVMYELHGMKYKEIGKTLGIPLNTVKVTLLRARKKLQEELKHYESNEVF